MTDETRAPLPEIGTNNAAGQVSPAQESRESDGKGSALPAPAAPLTGEAPRTDALLLEINEGRTFDAPEQPCRGCGKPLLIDNAWMEDGCPCNTPAGVNNLNLYRWRLLHELQQRESRAKDKLEGERQEWKEAAYRAAGTLSPSEALRMELKGELTAPQSAIGPSRDDVLEEAAKVAEDEWISAASLARSKCAGDIARAIRALKNTPAASDSQRQSEGNGRIAGGSTAPEAVALSTTRTLWLWKNFVDGKPEYWAFDNPCPTHGGGDPMTLGEPCGYAILKDSTRSHGHPASEDAQVMAALVKRADRRKTVGWCKEHKAPMDYCHHDRRKTRSATGRSE